MPESPKHRLRVFLCHASADKPKVRELHERLVAEGWIDSWLDAAKLLPGQHWSTTIKLALAEADSIIIFISNHSINREGFVQREMNYAWDLSLEKPRHTIFLIPIRLEECEVPYDLRERQWADYFGDKKEQTYAALLQSLTLRYEQKLRIEAEEETRLKNSKSDGEAAKQKARLENLKSGREVNEKIERKPAGESEQAAIALSEVQVPESPISGKNNQEAEAEIKSDLSKIEEQNIATEEKSRIDAIRETGEGNSKPEDRTGSPRKVTVAPRRKSPSPAKSFPEVQVAVPKTLVKSEIKQKPRKPIYNDENFQMALFFILAISFSILFYIVNRQALTRISSLTPMPSGGPYFYPTEQALTSENLTKEAPTLFTRPTETGAFFSATITPHPATQTIGAAFTQIAISSQPVIPTSTPSQYERNIQFAYLFWGLMAAILLMVLIKRFFPNDYP